MADRYASGTTGAHPTGKTLVQGVDNQLYIVSREVNRDDGEVAYVLHAVRTVVVDAYRHKWQAVAAVCGEEANR